MNPTGISYVTRSWNPVEGCSMAGAGCANCYAERTAGRMRDGAYQGLVALDEHGRPRWTGQVELIPDRLAQPARAREGQRILAPTMGDWLHPNLSDEDCLAVLGAAVVARQHRILLLTKRPARLLRIFAAVARTAETRFPVPALACHAAAVAERYGAAAAATHLYRANNRLPSRALAEWPPRHVWFGFSAWDQLSLEVGAKLFGNLPVDARRWISLEPLIGEVHGIADLLAACDARLVVVGGETGQGARVCEVPWIRRVVRECADARRACYVKQLGAAASDPENGLAGAQLRVPREAEPLISCRLRDRAGANPAEWREDLRLRLLPGELLLATEIAEGVAR